MVGGVVLASALAALLVRALLRSRRSELHAGSSEQPEQIPDDDSLRSPGPGDFRATALANPQADGRQPSVAMQMPAGRPATAPGDKSPAVSETGAPVFQLEELPSVDRGTALPPPGSAAPFEAADDRQPAEMVQQADDENPLREAGGENATQAAVLAAGEAAVTHDAPLPVGGSAPAATDSEPETAPASLAPDGKNAPAGHDEAPKAALADLTISSDEVVPGSRGEPRPDAGSVSAVVTPPAAVVSPTITTEAPGSQPRALREPPAPSRGLRQYRPAARAPAAPRAAPPDSEERAGRDRALPIEVRLVFERAGFCRVSLLPRRGPALPVEIAVSGSGDPPELLALQDEWYQDVVLPDTGALLRRGIEWEGTLSDGQVVRWSLSGREIYVLCRHNDLHGFVSTPRLIFGEEHEQIVLCTAARVQEVRRAIELTGSPNPATLDGTTGIPPDWVGLRGVFPRTPVAPSPLGDIFDALRPLADVDVVLTGGIRLERLTWLIGYPPHIRLHGDIGATGNVVIDGQEATLNPDGTYVVPGWDLPGQHQVWCASASRSYSIGEGAEDWEAWDAYTWSMGDFSAEGEGTRPVICGVLVLPPRVAPKERRAVIVPASNSILLGPVPGQIHTCGVRGDIRAEACIGFPWFDPVWAMPADPLRCDKRVARVLLVGDPRPVGEQDLPQRGGGLEQPERARRELVRRIKAWCSAISNAGRKGLRTEPPGAEIATLWQGYKQQAKAIRRGVR